MACASVEDDCRVEDVLSVSYGSQDCLVATSSEILGARDLILGL